MIILIPLVAAAQSPPPHQLSTKNLTPFLSCESFGQGLDRGKPALGPVSDWWLEEIKRNSHHAILQAVPDRVAL